MSLFSPDRGVNPFSTWRLRSALALAFASLCVALLCTLPVVAETEFRVTALSRVSGVSISYLSQQDGNSRFVIRNDSGRAITAYDVLVVPTQVATGRKNGRYVCKGQCSDHPEVGTIEAPAIASGGTKEEWYPADKCDHGAVILESAVFDDETYSGGERAAAWLVATQLGSQAEVDRILSAVSTIMDENGSQTESRGTEVDLTLGGLPTDADGQEEAFSRWFPNIRDCSHHFSQVMQKASSEVLGQIRRNLQSLTESGPPSDGSLSKWWDTTKHVLQSYGCAGCAEKMSMANPPARLRQVSIGCRAPKSGKSSSGLSSASSSGGSDDGSDSGDLQAEDDAPLDDGTEVGDQSAANDSDSSVPAQAAADSQPAQSNTAAAANSGSEEKSSEQAALPLQVPARSRCLPMSPTMMGGIMPANDMAQRGPRPVADEMFYPRYFRYVERWDRCLGDGQWPEETMERYPDPYPQEMNDDQVEAISVMAADWVETQREETVAGTLTGTPSPLAAVRATTWAQAQEAMQRRQTMIERREERAKLVDARIGSLKLALGTKMFRAFDDYAHELFNAIPGQMVRQQLPENAMLARYLRLIATMDKYASDKDDDGRAAAKARADEQAACGLSDTDEQVLRDMADSLSTLRGPTVGLRARRVESSEIAATDAQEETPADQPAAVPALAPEERTRSFVSFMDRVQSNISKPGFARLEARLHVLYDSEGMNRVVAKDDTPQNDSEQGLKSNRTTNEALPPQR
jgi:hypothetical protein